MRKIELHYRRGPEVTVYEQELLHDEGQLIVTRAPFKPSRSLLAQVPGLEDREYRAVWFVAEGEWYDLGKIYDHDYDHDHDHDRKGALQGYYCDIIRPPRRTAAGLEIEDLFLDLWVFPDGRYIVLDEEELEEAVNEGWLEPKLAKRAREELRKLIEELDRGQFPPAFIKIRSFPWGDHEKRVI